jgi:hypothetical protein
VPASNFTFISKISGKSALDIAQKTVKTLRATEALSSKEKKIIHSMLFEHNYQLDKIEEGVGKILMRYPGRDVCHVVCIELEKKFSMNGIRDVEYLWLVLAPDNMDLPRDFDLAIINAFFKRKSHQTSLKDLIKAYFVHLPQKGENDDQHTTKSPTGFLAGVRSDIKSRLPHYASDVKDGLCFPVLFSLLSVFFSCLAPAITFGGLLMVLTQGQIGPIETIVATASAGMVFALFSGQPITFMAATGPIMILIGILYGLCRKWNIPFLPFYAWTGIWAGIILMVCSCLNIAAFVAYLSRFVEEIYASMIAFIFIEQGVGNVVAQFMDIHVTQASALLTLLLAFGTYSLCNSLSTIRTSPYLRRRLRQLISNFGIVLGIASMSFAANFFHNIPLTFLNVPDEIYRSWLVDFASQPYSVMIRAIFPAIFLSILLFMNQGITARLVNNKKYHLKKGDGYHLDLLILGIITILCSLFGLPWMVGSAVVSLNHINSISKIKVVSGQESIVSVCENRVSGFFVHALLLLSLMALSWIRMIPMPVLYGIFVFMGCRTLHSNQFIERIKLWVMDPDFYPTTYYLRRVPKLLIHQFTSIQFICFLLLVYITHSSYAILFSLFVLMMIPFRLLLNRFFHPAELLVLDGQEDPSEEEELYLG